MKRFLFRVCLAGLSSLWLAQATPGYAQGAQGHAAGLPPAPGAAENAAATGVQVMTRGPIHEAFAEPVNTGSVRPLVVPKKPPPAIEETPPDVKPAGEDAAWISGYWGWDGDRKDFVWVSGVWRVSPPGQRWIPGCWTEVSGGYQWVPGFWSPAASEEVDYYPEPPASLEQGPTSDPPSPDYVWIPGCWRWRLARYVWQPGYWALARPDWVWVPASYYCCPHGWVFSEGYWDYPLAGRGLAFAPVYFGGGSLRPRFGFSPTVAIDTGILSFYLFTRPSCYHYYFGYYREHPDRRPPHDLAAQRQLLSRAEDRPDSRFLAIADTVQDWRQKADAPVPLVAVSGQEKAKLAETARMLGELKSQRAQLEGGVAIGPGAGAAKTAEKAPAAAEGSAESPAEGSLAQASRGRACEGGERGAGHRARTAHAARSRRDSQDRAEAATEGSSAPRDPPRQSARRRAVSPSRSARAGPGRKEGSRRGGEGGNPGAAAGARGRLGAGKAKAGTRGGEGRRRQTEVSRFSRKNRVVRGVACPETREVQVRGAE